MEILSYRDCDVGITAVDTARLANAAITKGKISIGA